MIASESMIASKN